MRTRNWSALAIVNDVEEALLNKFSFILAKKDFLTIWIYELSIKRFLKMHLEGYYLQNCYLELTWRFDFLPLFHTSLHSNKNSDILTKRDILYVHISMYIMPIY